MAYAPISGPLVGEHLVAGGEVLARGPDGRVVFVSGLLPGESASVEIVKEKRDWARATVAELHSTSPLRVNPPCVQRQRGCGGCDWQHLDASAQLPAKVGVVAETFRRIAGHSDLNVFAGQAVDPSGYRTTIRVVGGEDGLPAFRRERSHDTIGAARCLVANDGLQSVLDSIEVDPGLEVSIRVSVATDEATAHWDKRRGQVRGLPRDVATGRSASLTEYVGEHGFWVSSGSFFQSGPQAAALLVEAVRNAAPELESAGAVVDAYAGVGLFAKAAASPDSRLIAIESSRWSAADCEKNLNGRNAAVVRTRVEKWVGDGSADVLIADPSRSGLGRAGVEALATAGAPVLVLVSCDPAAAARDSVLLGRVGYVHAGTEVLDLFPHTHHVECVTRFFRG